MLSSHWQVCQLCFDAGKASSLQEVLTGHMHRLCSMQDIKAFYQAARDGDVQLIRQLLARGMNANAKASDVSALTQLVCRAAYIDNSLVSALFWKYHCPQTHKITLYREITPFILITVAMYSMYQRYGMY